MKPLNPTFIVTISLVLMLCFSSCEDQEQQVPRLIEFQWNMVESENSLSSYHSMLINPTIDISGDALTYNHMKPDMLYTAAPGVDVLGSPPELLKIVVSRQPEAEEMYANLVLIHVEESLMEGRTYTFNAQSQSYARIHFGHSFDKGDRSYSTLAGDDTFLEISIDRLDDNERIIEGTFLFAMRDEQDPHHSQAIVGFNGKFHWKY